MQRSASNIIPAHVPQTGLLFAKACKLSHIVLVLDGVGETVDVPINPIAVDSPPGSTIPSSLSKSCGVRSWKILKQKIRVG
jgi:hypothetical protein